MDALPGTEMLPTPTYAGVAMPSSAAASLVFDATPAPNCVDPVAGWAGVLRVGHPNRAPDRGGTAGLGDRRPSVAPLRRGGKASGFADCQSTGCCVTACPQPHPSTTGAVAAAAP